MYVCVCTHTHTPRASSISHINKPLGNPVTLFKSLDFVFRGNNSMFPEECLFFDTRFLGVVLKREARLQGSVLQAGCLAGTSV